MFVRVFKVSAGLVLAVSIYLGVKYNSIQVPRGLENGHIYKKTSFAVSTMGSLARTLAWMNLGQEAENFRSIGKLLVSRMKADEPNDQSRVVKTDKSINGVRVVVYEPKDKVKGKLPGLLFYHGGGYAFGTPGNYKPLGWRV